MIWPMASRISHHLITLEDGRKISYGHWPGEGQPLVLLHGLFDSLEGWATFARWSPRNIYCFDLPGFGNSDCPLESTYQSFGDDLLEAFDLLELEDFVLVGHSLGGAIAATIAEELGDRVSHLALIAPAGFCRQELAEVASRPVVREIADVALPFWLSNPITATITYMGLISNGTPPTPSVLLGLATAGIANRRGARMATDAINLGGKSSQALYLGRGNYNGPVSELWGDADRLVPRHHLGGVLTAYPQVEATITPAMGHHPQVERPELLAAFIEDACRSGAARHQKLASEVFFKV